PPPDRPASDAASRTRARRRSPAPARSPATAGPGSGPFRDQAESGFKAPAPRSPSGATVLLQVPVDIPVADEEPADVLACRHRLGALAERRMRRDLERAGVDLVGKLLLRRLVGGAHELRAQLDELVVARPAEPARLLAARVHGRIRDRAPDVEGLPGGDEHGPAALVDL